MASSEAQGHSGGQRRPQGEKITIKHDSITTERIGRRQHLTWPEFLIVNSGGRLSGPGDPYEFRTAQERRESGSSASSASTATLSRRCPCTLL